jgi:heat shock factor-binding protein 1
MQNKFQSMSDNIIHKIDEMGNRIDDLERSVNDLMDEAGLDD